MAMYQKPHLLRYARELRVEKWEAQRVIFASDSLPQFEKEFNLYEVGEFRPEGVRDLMWRPEGCSTYQSLSGTLVDLLKSMPMLEKFSYNPQRYNTFYYGSNKTALQKTVSCRLLSHSPAQGMTGLLLDTLKNMPNLTSLTINFRDWDPFDPANYGPNSAIGFNSRYEPHLHGLVGFKNLEELVILGIMIGGRFNEIERVVKDRLLSNKSGRRLKRIEIRAHTELWEFSQTEQESYATGAHELLSWVNFMWDTCFPPSKRFRRRVRRSGLVDINIIFELGPTKWQFNYDKTSSYSCWQNIAALDLQGLPTTYTLETIDILVERFRLRQPQHLRVFAVKCRICYLKKFLGRCRGLRELYVLDPDITDSSSISDRIDIKGIHGVFDTIFKRHLLTLEVLVVEEAICIPQSGGTSEVINPIEGWKDRGGKLRELAVNIWGPWEEISRFYHLSRT
ncbi:hypothetical protein P167DRAFT_573049 [Morchella conica CCBAS932]|uniref:Uncharacterized protein n=1 Tax=Morchella conica CCBAS932 TaxID=1392247 RepID=A0A3N4KTA6_9PEZI|nr:hypothetical protein P167DRAFT_573049 [Morchella conica CCBAS932]